MAVVSICQEMGWDYDQYMNAPQWFIGLINIKFKVDGQKSRSKMPKK